YSARACRWVVESRALRRASPVAPGKAALPPRSRIKGRGHLPLSFAGEAAPSPPAIGFRFVPIDVNDRMTGFERRDGRELVSMPPPVAPAHPEPGVFGLFPTSPVPAATTPQIAASVSL